MKNIFTYMAIFLVIAACSGKKSADKTQTISTKPNIIFILADDLGYGDLGCYGQTKIQTPNIDALAKEGVRFTRHYSGSTVCAPSRCVLMTGLHTGHSYIRGNQEHQPEGQAPIPANTLTMAEILKQNGYTTGAFGKWGLGYPRSEGDPNNQGFDEFYGYNCQRIGHNYYPYHLWHNQDSIVLEGNEGKGKAQYAPELINRQAVKFIEDNKDKPFFLYYPTIIPHAELFAPEKNTAKYRGKLDPEKNFKGVDDGPRFKNGGYGSQAECHAAFAGMVDCFDEYVGNIVKKLDELGLRENTIIFVTSDTGAHLEGGADPDYFNSTGGLRGYKRDLFEGGIRTPMIVNCPAKFKAATSKHISAFWDILPTVADMTSTKLAAQTDGISFLPMLEGQSEQKEHDYLYWEFPVFGGRIAVLNGNMKYIKYDATDKEKVKEMLFDLSKDEGEQNDIAKDNPEIMQKMREMAKNAHSNSEMFPLLNR
ncbi:MAG: arylsulfatase [Bacteroidales bacterium]